MTEGTSDWNLQPHQPDKCQPEACECMCPDCYPCGLRGLCTLCESNKISDYPDAFTQGLCTWCYAEQREE